ISIMWSSDIDITGNNIELFRSGIILNDVDGVNISDNHIHDLRTNPISGSNVDNLVIQGNYMHDSTPWRFGGGGDHGDLIHLWTTVGQDAPSNNIVIEGNKLSQGNGQAMLGI